MTKISLNIFYLGDRAKSELLKWKAADPRFADSDLTTKPLKVIEDTINAQCHDLIIADESKFSSAKHFLGKYPLKQNAMPVIILTDRKELYEKYNGNINDDQQSFAAAVKPSDLADFLRNNLETFAYIQKVRSSIHQDQELTQTVSSISEPDRVSTEIKQLAKAGYNFDYEIKLSGNPGNYSLDIAMKNNQNHGKHVKVPFDSNEQRDSYLEHIQNQLQKNGLIVQYMDEKPEIFEGRLKTELEGLKESFNEKQGIAEKLAKQKEEIAQQRAAGTYKRQWAGRRVKKKDNRDNKNEIVKS